MHRIVTIAVAVAHWLRTMRCQGGPEVLPGHLISDRHGTPSRRQCYCVSFGQNTQPDLTLGLPR